MSRAQKIKQQLEKEFSPLFCDVQNESHKHNVSRDAETHFKIILVSEAFASQSRLVRHRLVQSGINETAYPGLHALTLKLYDPHEWVSAQNSNLESPPCLGGGRK